MQSLPLTPEVLPALPVPLPKPFHPLKHYVSGADQIGDVCGPNTARYATVMISTQPNGKLQESPALYNLVPGTVVVAPIDRGPHGEPRFMLGQLVSPHRAEGKGYKAQVLILGRYEFHGQVPVPIHLELTPPHNDDLPLFLAPPELLKACITGPDIAYPGVLLGPQCLPAPIRLPHFGPQSQGGIGEGWHGGVFGPPGSGKTVALSVLLACWARHPSLGMLIIDPQGQFAHDTFAEKTTLPFRLHPLFQAYRAGRFDPARNCLTLTQLKMEGIDLFVTQLITSGWFELLGIPSAKVAKARALAYGFFRALCSTTPWNTTTSWDNTCNLKIPNPGRSDDAPALFAEALAEQLSAVEPAGRRRDDLAAAMQNAIAMPFQNEALRTAFAKAQDPFLPTMADGTRRIAMESMLLKVLYSGAIVIVNASPQERDQDDPAYRYRMIYTLLNTMQKLTNESGRAGRQHANALVVLDEAADLAPQKPETPEQKLLSNFLLENVQKIRKAGVGIIFATQNIVGFRTQIYRNLNWRAYGIGLGVGADRQYMISKEGKQAVEFYESLPDPRSTKIYGVMLAGPIQALSSKVPVLFSATASNDELLATNPPHPAAPPPGPRPAPPRQPQSHQGSSRRTGPPAPPSPPRPTLLLPGSPAEKPSSSP